ncbi:hypothetical protein SAMN05518672_103573 [Chitinophaga sp. CF118]|nr:hypothetical protein SAMN05518672_103573 [Chitinophaga sp. CF118]
MGRHSDTAGKFFFGEAAPGSTSKYYSKEAQKSVDPVVFMKLMLVDINRKNPMCA